MRPRTLTACLALCACFAASAPARAQIAHQLRGDSAVVIGDGVSSKGSKPQFTGDDQAPFLAAIEALEGAQTGTVEVLTGTYVIDEPIEVSVPGLRIRGGPDARIVAGAELEGPCFLFAAGAADALLEGVTLEDPRDPPPAGPTLVDVRADRFSLLHCRVRRWNRLAPAARSVAVQLGHAEEGGVEGALLSGNRFLVGRLGAIGVPTVYEATGVCMLASVGGSGLRLLGNSFESDVATTASPVGKLEVAIALWDEVGALLSGNTLSHLEARVGGTPEPSAMIECIATADAGNRVRLSFQGNYVERLSAASVLSVVGLDEAPARVVVSGNAFGRVGDVVGGGLYLEHADGSLLCGNAFHIVGQELSVSPAVRVVQSDDVSLLGNSFHLPKNRLVWLSSCSGPLIRGNRFDGVPTLVDEAYLRLDDVLDASIVQNQFSAQHCPSIAITNALGTASVFLCGNTLPAGCLPQTSPGVTLVGCDGAGSGGNPSF
jgi:hypothetical protein